MSMLIAEVEENDVMDVMAEPSTISRPGVSWAAVLAGSAVIGAMTLLLLALGVGLGLSVVSPWGGSGASPTTFKIGTGLYLIVVAMISSALGGHITGRLRRRYVGIHSNEVYFRDTANGFVAWAVATVIGAVFLASAASTIVSGASAGANASGRTQDGGPAAVYVDRLLRPAGAAPPSAGNAAATAEVRGDLSRLLVSTLRERKDLTPEDRAYVAQVVSHHTGLSPADAEKRVDSVINQAKSDLDDARRATLQLALWLTVSLFLGAFASSIAAAEGGAVRDRNWGVPTSA